MYYPDINRQIIWENIHIYLFLIIVLIVLTLFIYIKLKYPFWNILPVYHTYDFCRSTFYRQPFIIYKKAIPNKFCDLLSISTMNYHNCLDTYKKYFVNLLQCYYIPSENTNFLFHLENLETYMDSHLSSSYISFYEIHEYSDIDSTITNKTLGCISSRSSNLIITNSDVVFETPIYYIDFICMHRDAPILYTRKLLQTHIYNQQLDNDKIMGSIFKKEGSQYSGIVPFIISSSSIFGIPSYFHKDDLKLPEQFVFIHFHKGNINILFDFLNRSTSRFSTVCITDQPNLLKMIENNILFCYGIKRFDEVYAIYFFRDMRTQYEEVSLSGCLLQLSGSINNTTSVDLFYKGFQKSIQTIVKKMNVFKLLMIEDIGSNRTLHDKIGGIPLLSIESTYYLYNIVVPCSPFYGSQSLIIL